MVVGLEHLVVRKKARGPDLWSAGIWMLWGMIKQDIFMDTEGFGWMNYNIMTLKWGTWFRGNAPTWRQIFSYFQGEFAKFGRVFWTILEKLSALGQSQSFGQWQWTLIQGDSTSSNQTWQPGHKTMRRGDWQVEHGKFHSLDDSLALDPSRSSVQVPGPKWWRITPSSHHLSNWFVTLAIVSPQKPVDNFVVYLVKSHL